MIKHGPTSYALINDYFSQACGKKSPLSSDVSQRDEFWILSYSLHFAYAEDQGKYMCRQRKRNNLYWTELDYASCITCSVAVRKQYLSKGGYVSTHNPTKPVKFGLEMLVLSDYKKINK
jgi:hypothetical protein